MMRSLVLLALLLPFTSPAAAGDPRVLVQGFTVESHQGSWTGKWYAHLREKISDLQAARIDLLWLPPPSQGEGAGYHPQQLYLFENNYGTEAEHRALLKDLRFSGIQPVADLVVNHRQGTGGWAVFENPAWPSYFICSTDEFWRQDPAKFPNPRDREIFQRGKKGGKDYPYSDFPDWPGARDLDHENIWVREAIHAYLAELLKLGYTGWRWDMAKGFDPRYVGEYNRRSFPVFSVGEYWDGDVQKIERWVRETASGPVRPSYAFDFPTYYGLAKALRSRNFPALTALTQSGTLLGRLPSHAVTFIENHDTGKPSQPDDTLPNDERLMQAYAFLLTHPGVPTIFWKHFDTWGRAKEIGQLVRARKAARIHSASAISVHTTENLYVAYVGEPGAKPSLVLHLGVGKVEDPDPAVWKLAADGVGYRVWIRK
jgi:alpha-amylase